MQMHFTREGYGKERIKEEERLGGREQQRQRHRNTERDTVRHRDTEPQKKRHANSVFIILCYKNIM